MNSLGKSDYDPLKKYIDPDRIEEAPAGFTEKVMSRIHFEVVPAEQRKKIRIPLVSGVVTLIFMIIALFVPSGTDAGIFGLFRNIDLNMPGLVRISLPEFRDAGIILYIVAACIVLIVFDSLLNRLFHRQKS